MRQSVFALGLVVGLGACKGATTTAPPAQSTSAPTTPATNVAPSATATTVGTPTATATATPTATATATPTATATAIAVPPGPPLFTYVEGTDALSFWRPTTLRLVRGGATPKTCMSELSTGRDNMWTGPDVEASYGNADVQAGIKRGTPQSYLPDADGGVITDSSFATTKVIFEWRVTTCRGCIAAPPGVAALHKVLAGVMMNRRLLCP